MTPMRAGSTSIQAAEQIDGPQVVPDGLHRRAGVSQVVNVDLVFAEVGIVGSQRDVAPLGQLACVSQLEVLAEPGRLVLADCDRLMQAEHGRVFAAVRLPASIRNQQPGRHAVAGLGGECDLLARKAGFFRRRDHLDVERDPALAAGQRRRRPPENGPGCGRGGHPNPPDVSIARS